MTKEEKRLIELGWKKEKENLYSSKEEWVKEYTLFPVMYTRFAAFTQLCIGIFLYDKFLNELHLLHFNNPKFSELTGYFVTRSNSITSIEYLFYSCGKKIEEETFKVKELYQDDNFFKHRLGDTIYVLHEGDTMRNDLMSYETCFLNPDLEDPEKYFFDDMLGRFNLTTMMQLSQDEVVYKKFKLNKNANT